MNNKSNTLLSQEQSLMNIFQSIPKYAFSLKNDQNTILNSNTLYNIAVVYLKKDY